MNRAMVRKSNPLGLFCPSTMRPKRRHVIVNELGLKLKTKVPSKN